MMETYLSRTYGQKTRSGAGDANDYPFWDYRSRRGSTPSLTSQSSSCCSVSSGRSEAGSESASLTGVETGDPYKISLLLLADAHELIPLLDLYQPAIDWIDPDLRIIRVAERVASRGRELTAREPKPKDRLAHPSFAIVIFLQEEDVDGCERTVAVRRYLEQSPWKFHHSEEMGRNSVQPYLPLSQNYYCTKDEYPLWAVRLVHYGKEHIRLVVFSSLANWRKMVDFYKLLVDKEPEVERSDFCLFTVYSQISYDVQLTLKRLSPLVSAQPTDSVVVQFRVLDMRRIVPHFPNVCRPVSDAKWRTLDYDGNVIMLEVANPAPASAERFQFAQVKTVSKLGFYV